MTKNLFMREVINHFHAKKTIRIMKITSILLFVAVLQISAHGLSQDANLKLASNNATLAELIEAIESQSEFRIFYKTDQVNIQEEFTFVSPDGTVASLLDQALEGSNITYRVLDKVIVLANKSIVQQQNTVGGIITDASTGEPLPGVAIQVQGTLTGGISNADGSYSVRLADGASVLVFSFVGYKTQEIPIEGRTVIDVFMVEEVTALEEVVVVGYGVQRKSNITGAIVSVRSDDIENRTSENVGQAIQGKISGVQVLTTSGAPNASTSFRIRGYSNTGASDPLYIVDGLKVNSISFLNSENIQSIEILKDAASAAIYGAEAGNGVVLITTKSGKSEGTSQIFYNMQLANTSQVNKMDMMNATQFKEYWIESGRANESSFGTADTDWQERMFDKGHMQLHTLGFQGNNERGSLYIALNYLLNNGIVVGNKDQNERVTGQINASYNLKSWLTVGTTNSIERGKTSSVSENNYTGTGSVIGGGYYYDPTVPAFYENDGDAPAYLLQAEASGFNVFRKDGKLYGSSALMQSNLWNPYGMIDYLDTESWRTNLNGTMFADFKPVKGLTFTSRLGYRIGNNYNTTYQYPYYWNPNQSAANSNFSASINHSFYFQFENFANYLLNIGKNDISVMAGMSYARNNTQNQSGSTNLLTNNAPNYRYLDYSSASANDNIGGNISEASNMSYFGRIGYTYDNRYTIQGVFRADAYDLSKLSAENRWGFFPSVSASWNVTNEAFMRNIINPSILSTLKLRASWGINGNISSLSGYAYTTSLSLGGQYYSMYPGSGLITGAYPSNQLPNPELTWEESRQIDVGFDATFISGRLTFGYDYYKKTTTDFLSTRSAPFITGNSTQVVNAGEILNSGMEFDLGWKDKIGGLSYSISTNLSTLHNEVIESPYGETGRTAGGRNFFVPITYLEAGYPIWYIRTYVTDHIDETTGLPVYRTAAELGTDDGMDFTGSSIPDFTYGVTLDLAYKGIDLKVFGSGVQGNEMFLAVYRPDLPIANLPAYIYNERWTPTNTDAKYPRANQSDGRYAQSDLWVHDASYFRIKQIQLGYSLPVSLISKIKLTSFRAYISLENLFTFTSYPGNDPESISNTSGAGFYSGSLGIDRVNYPQMKSFVLGCNIAF